MRFMKLLMGMPKKSKNIVIIMPARGGSKRLKNKNSEGESEEISQPNSMCNEYLCLVFRVRNNLK